MSDTQAQIDECQSLFLTEIEELGGNRLHLLVYEGTPTGQSQQIRIGDSVIDGANSIEVTPESRRFEIERPGYGAYAVLNKSYTSPPDDEEPYIRRRFRVYTKSHFRDYLSRSTFATDEYPGPMQHFEICCDDQIVNVVSTSSPIITVPIQPAADTKRKSVSM